LRESGLSLGEGIGMVVCLLGALGKLIPQCTDLDGSAAQFTAVGGVGDVRLRHAQFQTALLDREFGTKLIPFGKDFLNGKRHLRLKPPTGESVRPPPEGRCEGQRQESREQEPKRENHQLFNHADLLTRCIRT
jgi:hypothetical protein